VLKAARDTRGGQALEDAPPLEEGFWSGDYAAGNEGSRTVENESAWTALWRTLSTSAAPPVDFKKSLVVAVFLGPRPTGGYAVEFVETKRLAHSLIVRWRHLALRLEGPAPLRRPGTLRKSALKNSAFRALKPVATLGGRVR
jgi:hypothetical protein